MITTYKENKNISKDKINNKRIILSFLGACKILVEINPLTHFLRGNIYSLISFFGLPGPDFLVFGLGMNTFGGLHGPAFFLFGISWLLGR